MLGLGAGEMLQIWRGRGVVFAFLCDAFHMVLRHIQLVPGFSQDPSNKWPGLEMGL